MRISEMKSYRKYITENQSDERKRKRERERK